MANPYSVLVAQHAAGNSKIGSIEDAAIVTCLLLGEAAAVTDWTAGPASNAAQRVLAHLTALSIDNQFSDLLRRHLTAQVNQ